MLAGNFRKFLSAKILGNARGELAIDAEEVWIGKDLGTIKAGHVPFTTLRLAKNGSKTLPAKRSNFGVMGREPGGKRGGLAMGRELSAGWSVVGLAMILVAGWLYQDPGMACHGRRGSRSLPIWRSALPSCCVQLIRTRAAGIIAALSAGMAGHWLGPEQAGGWDVERSVAHRAGSVFSSGPFWRNARRDVGRYAHRICRRAAARLWSQGSPDADCPEVPRRVDGWLNI